MPNVSAVRVSGRSPDICALLAEALHGVFDFLVVRPAAVGADEVLGAGGWIDLTAVEAAELVVMPPDGVQVWQTVAPCFERLLGNDGSKKPVALT